MRRCCCCARVSLALGLLVLAGGCGGSQNSISAGPFSEQDGLIFDHAVDFFGGPEALSGAWLESYREDLRARVERSDRIDLVTVRSMHTGVDLERKTSLRLDVEVEDRFVRAGDRREYSLEVREDEAGYRSVRGSEARLLNEQFVAFLRFEELEDSLVIHWHLSKASDWVVAAVQEAAEGRGDSERSTRRTVVVH